MLVLFYLYISVASLAKIPSVDGYVAVCLVLTIERCGGPLSHDHCPREMETEFTANTVDEQFSKKFISNEHVLILIKI